MLRSNYPTQAELVEVLEIVDNELWLKESISPTGRKTKRRLVKNIPSNGDGGYCRVWVRGRMVQYHTLIYILCKGDIPKGLIIDHVNGCKTDNNIENLRLVTQRENGQNRYTHRGGRLVGCYYNNTAKKWTARIQINGTHFYLGNYNTEMEAHDVYCNACDLSEAYKGNNKKFRILIGASKPRRKHRKKP